MSCCMHSGIDMELGNDMELGIIVCDTSCSEVGICVCPIAKCQERQ
jgi:hypothetical protein